jgi:hypothetical protein
VASILGCRDGQLQRCDVDRPRSTRGPACPAFRPFRAKGFPKFRVCCGTFLVASPMISKARTTAKLVFSSAMKESRSIPHKKRCAFSIASKISRR